MNCILPRNQEKHHHDCPEGTVSFVGLVTAALSKNLRRYEPMAPEMINGTFRQTNLPNESDEYLSKREELRLAEIELMRQRERVAELRRGLPQGTEVQDYAFEEGPANLDAGDTPIRSVRLSELFSAPNRTLVVYHFMFGKKKTTPCPMCTLWIDGWN